MTPPDTVARPDLRVCFVGDSYVAGVGDASALGWVGRVTASARAAGHRLTSYNLGVRGETSTQVVSRIAVEAVPRLSAAGDPRVILSFGVNDTVEVGGIPRTAVGETVGALRDAARMVAPERLLMVGPTATADVAQNERIEVRNGALHDEAARLGIRYLPVFESTLADPVWQQQVAVGDGYHPDAEGYGALASFVTAPILGWLSEPRASVLSP